MRGSQLTQNFIEHHICLLQSVVIPEPNHSKSFRFQISRPFGVAGKLGCMLSAVEFDDKPLFEADEVDDLRWNRMLSPKFESPAIAIFQMQPNPRFGVG